LHLRTKASHLLPQQLQICCIKSRPVHYALARTTFSARLIRLALLAIAALI